MESGKSEKIRKSGNGMALAAVILNFISAVLWNVYLFIKIGSYTSGRPLGIYIATALIWDITAIVFMAKYIKDRRNVKDE